MTKLCVLVVIDDADLNAVLGDVLLQTGVDVVSAYNGRDALTKLIAMPVLPCLVLVDINMPVMNGVEFIEQVRQHPKLKTLRICAMSCAQLPERAPPVPDFLSLPCSVESLTELVDSACTTPQNHVS